MILYSRIAVLILSRIPLNPHLLTKILEGDDMTPKEKNFYYASRKALDTNA